MILVGRNFFIFSIDSVWERYTVQIDETFNAKVNFDATHLSEVGTEYVEGKYSQLLHTTTRGKIFLMNRYPVFLID